MKIKWPKDCWEWVLFAALILSIARMYLYEQLTGFQFIVVILLLSIFNRLNRKEVHNHTHHVEVTRPSERK